MRVVTAQYEARIAGHGKVMLGLVGRIFSKTDVQIEKIVQANGEPLAPWQFSPKQMQAFNKSLLEASNQVDK